MTEEIQEIERPIKQSAELRDSLIRLARKLQVLQNTISRVGRQEDTRQVKATNDQAFIM
jgi:predicted translin family RNA/ssDNA-binding protein